MAGITALVGALKGMIGIGKQIATVSAHFEDVEAGLKTVTGSAEKGAALFEQLRKYSFDTTFGVDELAAASTQLMNVGVSATELTGKLDTLGNLAQGSKEAFASLTDIFAKITASGKAGSQQLAMIANRGIPVNQVLKTMGVTGTATAEQVEQAFQILTGEIDETSEAAQKAGDYYGKFAGAMNNVNDTINGKLGFINDTLNEIAVNFGKASGFTDAFKAALDLAYTAVDKINNVLMSINDNPVAKALFTGVITAAVSSLAVLIGTTLVAALAKVIVKLGIIATLKAIIDPKTLGIAALVGGLAGVTAAIVSVKNSAEEAAEAIQKMKAPDSTEGWDDFYTNEIKKQLDNLKEQRDKLVVQDSTSTSMNVKSFDDWKASNALRLANEVRNLTGQERTDKLKSLYEDYVKSVTDAVAGHNDEIDSLNDEIAFVEQLYEKQKQLTKNYDDYNNTVKKAGDINTNMMTSNEKSLNESIAQLKEINDLVEKNKAGWNVRSATGSTETKHLEDSIVSRFDTSIARLKKTIEDTKIKIAFENEGDWQKTLRSALGLSEKEASKKSGDGYVEMSGKEMVDTYNDLWQKYMSSGIGDSGTKQMEYLNSLPQVLQTLQSANLHLSDADKFKVGDSSVDALLRSMQKGFDNVFDPLKSSIEDVNNMTDEQKSKVEALTSVYDAVVALFGESNSVIKEFKKKLEEVTPKNTSDSQEEIPIDDSIFQYKSILTKANENLKAGVDMATSAVESFGLQMAEKGASAVQGLDSVIQGFQQGGVLGAIISALIEVLTAGLQDVKGYDKVMNGFSVIADEMTNFQSEMEPVFEHIITIFETIGKTLNNAFRGIQPIFKFMNVLLKLTNVFMKLLNAIETFITNLLPWVDDIEEKEEEEQATDLTEAYKALLQAMKDNEEEYEKRKKQLNAQSYADSVQGVHDMILTPQGRFSTDPDDYIIATKNPAGLNEGNGSISVVTLQPIINNNMADVAEVTTSTETDENGMERMIISFSRKAAMDYATGENGWDSAVSARQSRASGRSISV